ncbi:hypothetical protein BV898_15596 [Hypsibius exemplaris]|uniref:Knottins-like domain-containing protein n=1 Tax=Hypsibius exemplaris TaxID=2072580 RepID=A0A9X6RKN1_HYPEX|nr:hypothetical protein BV898_15596 [Hypsibius exemplaris]
MSVTAGSAVMKNIHPVALLSIALLLRLEVGQAVCISETYIGECSMNDQQDCQQTCQQEGRGTGKCGPFRSMRVCYCDNCPDLNKASTTTTISADLWFQSHCLATDKPCKADGSMGPCCSRFCLQFQDQVVGFCR